MENTAPLTQTSSIEENLDSPQIDESASLTENSFIDEIETKKKRRFLPKLWHKIIFGLFLFLVLLLTATAVYSYRVARSLMTELDVAKMTVLESKAMVSSQNLALLPEKINQLQDSEERMKADFQRLSFYGKIPFVKGYYQDGEIAFAALDHALLATKEGVNAILPYASLLGLEGEGSFEGGTTQERLVLILETLKEIQPSIDYIDAEISQAAQLVNQINPQRYPEKVASLELRSTLEMIQQTALSSSQTLSDYKPVLAQLGKMAGGESPQKYLLLFQNDNELRPTGGFLTAYAIINIEKGVVTSEKSDDIYELDQKFNKRIAIPAVLGRYLTTESRYHLRDMNISPDFKSSMNTFYENYQTIRGEPDDIDGIIAVDTQVLTDLLRVIGPVEIPGYGVFSAENDVRCDCPQVVYALSEIITKPTPYLRDDRKGVLGPMMKAILAKTYELDKSKFPELLDIGLASIQSRHVQTYFMDEESQKAAEQINMAGRLYTAYENKADWQLGQDLDFLAIIDANLAGAKSNLFTSYEVKQTVSAPLDGYIEKTVEITYKNSRAADNCNLEAGLLCLNSTLNDWIRIYVPLGSELIEMQGLTKEVEVYDEESYRVFDGYFVLEPMGLAKIRISYKVPYLDSENYHLKMWKQGGIDTVPVLMDVTGGEEAITLDKDLEYSTAF